MLRRLIKASAIVIGTGLLVSACAPVKMGAAAVVGDQRITVATLGTEVTNLHQAATNVPGVNLTQAQETQSTLTWLIRYQINEELARQQGITISTAQAEAALDNAYKGARTYYAQQQGLTNVTNTFILVASGVPPDTSGELGRYFAIENEYQTIANGGTAPTSSSAQAAANAKLQQAQCRAAKALNIQVNPQFGRIDYSQPPYQVVPAPAPVSGSAGPAPTASASGLAPAC